MISVASKNGWLMTLPYLGLAIVSVFYLRTLGPDSFGGRFTTAFTAYAIATAMIWLYIQTFVDPRVLRPLTLRSVIGPLGGMLVIGVIGGGIVSLLSRPAAIT
jgi:hypothetical protein